MGYVLKVRLAAFLAGAATASAAGFYVLHRDYKVAHEFISEKAVVFWLVASFLDLRFFPFVIKENLSAFMAPKHPYETVLDIVENAIYYKCLVVERYIGAAELVTSQLVPKVQSLYESLDERISSLERLKEVKPQAEQLDVTE